MRIEEPSQQVGNPWSDLLTKFCCKYCLWDLREVFGMSNEAASTFKEPTKFGTLVTLVHQFYIFDLKLSLFELCFPTGPGMFLPQMCLYLWLIAAASLMRLGD